MDQPTRARTEGAAAAAIVAAGIGCTVLGILVTAAEASQGIRSTLNMYNPVGPLSGKTIVASAGFFISWLILHVLWKDKDVNLGRMTTVAYILILLGLLLTFPPIFELFASE
jgi:hypothetical protein